MSAVLRLKVCSLLSLSLSTDLLDIMQACIQNRLRDMHDMRWKGGECIMVSISVAQLEELNLAWPIVVPRLWGKASFPTLAEVLR
jgi:hypothetical protein